MNLQRGNAPCAMGTVAHQRKLEEIYNFRHNSNRRSLGLYFLLSLLLYVSYYSEPLSLFGRNKLSNEYLPLGEKKTGWNQGYS